MDKNIFSLLPVTDGKYCGTYDCGEDCFMNLYADFSAEKYKIYLEQLTDAGFTVLQQTNNNGNLFCALSKDIFVTVYFTPDTSLLRVTACKDNNFPLFEKPDCKDGKTCFYAFENDHTLIDCGMCLLVQCPDYSFFIVDSGHYFQFNDNDRIYKFMRERTPAGQKVVVNGWFITHAHTDHISKLIDFIKYNTDDVTIEGFYQNLLPDGEYNESGNPEEREMAQKLRKVLRDYPAPVYNLHSGMRFFVRNLAFDVLCTHEDAYPVHIDDFNDSSAVLMMTAENSRIFIPGDAAVLESKILESRFSDSLKCDVIQVAHHGHTGLSARCYELLGADTAVFPVTRIMFEQDIKRHEADRRIIELAGQYYITSDGTVCVPLPYSRESVYKLPDETLEDFEKIKRVWRYVYPEEYMDYIYEKFIENGGSDDKLLLPTNKRGFIEAKPWVEGC